MPVYLIYLSIFFLPPVLVLGWLLRDRWPHVKRTVLWSLLFTFTFGLVWDWFAVQTGLWRYDSAPTIGIWFYGLPIEEFIGFYVLGTLLIIGVPLVLIERTENV